MLQRRRRACSFIMRLIEWTLQHPRCYCIWSCNSTASKSLLHFSRTSLPSDNVFQELTSLFKNFIAFWQLFPRAYFTFQELHCLFSKSLLHFLRTSLPSDNFFQELTSLFKNTSLPPDIIFQELDQQYRCLSYHGQQYRCPSHYGQQYRCPSHYGQQYRCLSHLHYYQRALSKYILRAPPISPTQSIYNEQRVVTVCLTILHHITCTYVQYAVHYFRARGSWSKIMICFENLQYVTVPSFRAPCMLYYTLQIVGSKGSNTLRIKKKKGATLAKLRKKRKERLRQK